MHYVARELCKQHVTRKSVRKPPLLSIKDQHFAVDILARHDCVNNGATVRETIGIIQKYQWWCNQDMHICLLPFFLYSCKKLQTHNQTETSCSPGNKNKAIGYNSWATILLASNIWNGSQWTVSTKYGCMPEVWQNFWRTDSPFYCWCRWNKFHGMQDRISPCNWKCW